MLDIILLVLTFPGVIIHEMSHEFFCRRSGLAVRRVRYFRIGNPAGYVVTDAPKKYEQALSITVGPFLINTIFSIAIFFFAFLVIIPVGSFLGLWPIIFLWLAFSIGIHSFPSPEDADVLWNFSKRSWKTALWIPLAFPIVVLIKTANILRYIGFDFIYAILLALASYFLADAFLADRLATFITGIIR